MSPDLVGIDTRQGVFNQDEKSNGVSTTKPECLADKHANDSMNDSNFISFQDPSDSRRYHGVFSQLKGSVSLATRRLVLLPFTGHDEVSLRSNITAVAGIVNTYPLSDLAYTLSSRRSNYLHRAFDVVDAQLPSTLLDLSNAKFGKSSYRQKDLGFIFTGKSSYTFSTCPKRLFY